MPASRFVRRATHLHALQCVVLWENPQKSQHGLAAFSKRASRPPESTWRGFQCTCSTVWGLASYQQNLRVHGSVMLLVTTSPGTRPNPKQHAATRTRDPTSPSAALPPAQHVLRRDIRRPGCAHQWQLGHLREPERIIPSNPAAATRRPGLLTAREDTTASAEHRIDGSRCHRLPCHGRHARCPPAVPKANSTHAFPTTHGPVGPVGHGLGGAEFFWRA